MTYVIRWLLMAPALPWTMAFDPTARAPCSREFPPQSELLLEGRHFMLMPMKAPTNLRRLAVLAGALMIGACSADVTSAPAPSTAVNTPSMFVPTSSAKALIGVVDGTYTVTVDPTRDQSFNLGPNHLDIPAGAICNLGRS